MPDPDRDKSKMIGNSLNAGSLGFMMVICTAAGLGIGIAADRWFGWTPWGTLVFFAVGVAAGFSQLFREASRTGR